MPIRRSTPPGNHPVTRDDTPLMTTPWLGYLQGLSDGLNILAGLGASDSYADDVAAAAGNVELGQFYRSGNTVKVRVA